MSSDESNLASSFALRPMAEFVTIRGTFPLLHVLVGYEILSKY